MSEPGSQIRSAGGARDQFQPWVSWTLAFAIGSYWLHGATYHLPLLWPDRADLLAWGAGFGPKIAGEHQTWRLLSAGLVHRGGWHAAIGVAALLLAGRRLERLFGHAGFAVLFFASLIAASLTSLGLAPDSVFTGSIGALTGVYAAGTLVLWLEPARAEGLPRWVRLGLPIGLACAVPLAFVPGLSGPGVLGGAIAGALLGLVFDRLSRGLSSGLELPLLFGALVVLLFGGALLAFQRAGNTSQARGFRLTEEASLALEQGDAAKALALGGEAAALLTDELLRRNALEVRMDAALKLRDGVAAEEAATRLLAMAPRDRQALGGRCDARDLQRKLDEAIADCAALAKLDGPPASRSWIFTHLADLQLRKGDAAAALESGNAALALAPHSRYGHLVHARALYALGKSHDADQELAEVARREPDVAEMWLALYSVALARNDLDEAARDCEEAMRIDPANRNAGDGRAEIFARRGQFELAIARLDATIARHPDDAGLLNNRAWNERAIGRLEPALRDITRSLELGPDDAPALGTRCWIEADLGRTEDALRDCTRSSLHAPPPGIDAGMVRYLAGDFADADAQWTAVIAKDPYLEFEIGDYVKKARAHRPPPAGSTANPP